MKALYDRVVAKKLHDPNNLLGNNPWVDGEENSLSVNFQNIGACSAVVKADGTLGSVVKLFS